MRIVGGKEAEKGRFPYQAQIWFQSSPGKSIMLAPLLRFINLQKHKSKRL
jgi:hypothetical protein